MVCQRLRRSSNLRSRSNPSLRAKKRTSKFHSLSLVSIRTLVRICHRFSSMTTPEITSEKLLFLPIHSPAARLTSRLLILPHILKSIPAISATPSTWVSWQTESFSPRSYSKPTRLRISSKIVGWKWQEDPA